MYNKKYCEQTWPYSPLQVKLLFVFNNVLCNSDFSSEAGGDGFTILKERPTLAGMSSQHEANVFTLIKEMYKN